MVCLSQREGAGTFDERSGDGIKIRAEQERAQGVAQCRKISKKPFVIN